jgi:hypothetical protein
MSCRGVLDQGRSKDAESVNKARAILTENAKGAGTDGEMVDEAVSRKARRILAAAGLEMAVYPSGPRAGQCGAGALAMHWAQRLKRVYPFRTRS